MRIYFDTNAVLDIFMRADRFSESFIAYDVSAVRGHEVFLSVSAMTDIAYVLLRNGVDKASIRPTLAAISHLFDLISVTPTDYEMALKSPVEDFEDALIVSTAERNEIDLIITRNLKDFEHSSVPAMTPSDFIESFSPPNYSYDVVEF